MKEGNSRRVPRDKAERAVNPSLAQIFNQSQLTHTLMIDYVLVQQMLLWIAKTYLPPVDYGQAAIFVRSFITIVKRYERTKGLPWTIKRLKFIRLVVTRYLSGHPIITSDNLIGLVYGFPKSFLFLKNWIDDGTSRQKSFVLTLLTVSKTFSYRGIPDYGSITQPFSGKYQTIDESFIVRFTNDLGAFITRPTIGSDSFFFTMKGGPSGLQLFDSLRTLRSLDGSTISALQQLIGPDGLETLGVIRKLSNRLSEPVDLRRLSLVYDPEMKCRIICLADYWSQLALKPIADQLFAILKTLPQDRTFTQNPFIQGKEGHSYHSFDLSSATDRFPLSLQKQLLKTLSGSGNISWAWGHLMSGLQVRTPEGNLIEYKVGQPMGARSSWAMFTLSHHLVVQYAAELCGQYPTKDYIMLGDDIVITDDTLAYHYKTVIEELGVVISEEKTHVSKDTYEFAKRWFHNGIEISPFPLAGLYSSYKSPTEAFMVIYSSMEKGWMPIDHNGSVRNAVELLDVCNKYPPKLRRSVTNTLYSFHFTLRNLVDPNYEELRQFMGCATKNSEYMLPTRNIMLESEFPRVFNVVANGMVYGQLAKMRNYKDNLLEVLRLDHEAARSPMTLEEWSRNHPVSLAVFNTVGQLEDLSKLLRQKKITLTELLARSELVDLDLLKTRERKSRIATRLTSLYGRLLYSQLRDDPDCFVALQTQIGRLGVELKSISKSNPTSIKRSLDFLSRQ